VLPKFVADPEKDAKKKHDDLRKNYEAVYQYMLVSKEPEFVAEWLSYWGNGKRMPNTETVEEWAKAEIAQFPSQAEFETSQAFFKIHSCKDLDKSSKFALLKNKLAAGISSIDFLKACFPEGKFALNIVKIGYNVTKEVINALFNVATSGSYKLLRIGMYAVLGIYSLYQAYTHYTKGDGKQFSSALGTAAGKGICIVYTLLNRRRKIRKFKK